MKQCARASECTWFIIVVVDGNENAHSRPSVKENVHDENDSESGKLVVFQS